MNGHRPSQVLYHGIPIECLVGDVANQHDMQAVVNAANAELLPGGGVAGAIHRAAGPKLAEECSHIAPIQPGEAVLTRAYNLPNSYVIHCLGPVYGSDPNEEKLLADCYRNAMRIADDAGITSIAFPAISTGAFGYPFAPAMQIACRSVLEVIPNLMNITKIRFVLTSSESAEIAVSVLNKECTYS